jgi:ribosomal protein S18 acetylase RimI-like enzyme
MEILDLRHFPASSIQPVLEQEGELWRKRLHWDYRASSRLLMQYLDNRMLPGYAAVEEGVAVGYVFCVYEESKAVVGDVYALGGVLRDANDLPLDTPQSATAIEHRLLRHLLELLQNSPQIDRIESQLLIHPSGTHGDIFTEAGFELYRRLFMVRSLAGLWGSPSIVLPPGLELRPWRDEDLTAASRLIAVAYAGHPDAVINDQYRTVQGSQRFLNNIVRYSGCGVFSPAVSHVVVDRASRELAAMVLGSRVSPLSGHITQVCVRPEFRRRGLARQLLAVAASSFLRQGVGEISLTVTADNAEAIDLYHAEGYNCSHTFDAAVWERPSLY